MDDNFFKQLEDSITDTGVDRVWKRQIGDKEYWLSPISYDAQVQANSMLMDDDLGPQAVNMTKRHALSHAIVGIGELDFRPYRHAGPVFPMVVKGKQVKVELHKYVYDKIGGWDAELVEAIFDVWVDLIESNKRQSLKDVQFENAKEPVDELMELEARSAQLREDLNLPPLVESTNFSKQDAELRKSLEEGEVPQDYPEDDDFNPFQVQPTENNPVPAPPVDSGQKSYRKIEPPKPPEQVAPQPPAQPPVQNIPIPQPDPEPELSPIQKALANQQSSIPVNPKVAKVVVPPGQLGSVENPHPSTPSIEPEVLDKPAERKEVQPPRVDRGPVQARNPRFNPPNRHR